MKIFLVYAGDPGNTSRQSPFTITRRLYDVLSSIAEVHYYDWCSHGPFATVDPGDIVIGHPNYPDGTALRQLFKSKCRARILIFPFHHGMPEINLPFDDLARRADAILSITGRYWYDTIDDTPFKHWKGKMTRLDMAVDPDQFPFVKDTFAPVGQRSFFYIGADRPEKGIHQLQRIFEGTSHQLYLYGMIGGECPLARLPNVHLRGWADTSPEWARDLAKTTDCLVHAGVSDANPTVLLEAACWGFPVACTPQSGYWPDRPFYGIDASNIDGVRELLGYIQTAPESVLKLRAQQNREVVLREHGWQTFTDTVLGVVRSFI